MPPHKERDIFIKIAKCRDVLQKSIENFRSYLEESCDRNSPTYYQARNFLKDGRTFYEEAVKEARKLLGSVPDYVPESVKMSKAQLLAESRIVVESRNLPDLEAEVAADDVIAGWISQDEIKAYLLKYFEGQKEGQRKTPNVKIRMMLDMLNTLRQQAQKLEIDARLKHQNPGCDPAS